MRKIVAKSPHWVAAFFVLTAVVFTFSYPYIAVVNNPNENVRTYMTMALVEEHTFKIDAIVAREGWTNDMAVAPDKAGQPHHYSVKAPAVSYAGIPIYWAFTKIAPLFGHPVPTLQSPPLEREWWLRASTFVLRLFTIQLPCLVFLVWFERWLRLFVADPVLRGAAVVATGLGTNYLAYSLMFVSHAPFAATAFASFAITTRARLRHLGDSRRQKASTAFWAGFFAGAATLLEYHALPVSVGLALYALTVFFRPTRLLALAAGGLLHVAALTFFQWRAFGNPLMPGHKMVENPAFAALHHQGVMGMSLPSLEVMKDISLSHSFGFFGTSPFMWLGFLALPFGFFAARGARKERRVRRTATFAWMSVMMLLWVTVGSAIIWRGGWTVGPRYLGAAPPFFAFGAATALDQLAGRSVFRRAVARGVAGGLAVASVATIGVVGFHFNTLPESITRPLAQFTLPLLRAGFVPHHAGELVGLDSPYPYYFALACLLAAGLLVMFVPHRDKPWSWGLRVAVAALALFIGMRPAFGTPDAAEGGEPHGVRSWAANVWEPKGRDFITTTEEKAQRFGPRRPCVWHKLASLERTMELEFQAVRDEKRAGVPAAQCK